MIETLAKLKAIVEKLENQKDDLTERIERAQEQLTTIAETIDALTDKIDKIDTLVCYELDDVIQAIDELESKYEAIA